MGGIENWNKLKTIELKCLKISKSHMNQTAKVNGTEKIVNTKTVESESRATMTIKPGKAMKIDDADANTISHFAMKVDDGHVKFMFWGKNPDTLSMEAANSYWPALNLQSNLLMSGNDGSIKMELKGIETINEIPCYKITGTDKYNHISTWFIDKATWYLIRTTRNFTYIGKEKNTEVNYSN